MTRRSQRELERNLDDLGATEQYTLQDYLWADLKDYYDGSLTRGERDLLENPKAHLPRSALKRLDLEGHL